MIEKELVSVLISTFNAEKTLESSLESIFNQTYENIEVFYWMIVQQTILKK